MIERLRERMRWGHIPFFSLPDDSFSWDFGVEEQFGINVFIRRGDRIFRTYFLNGRCIEDIGPVWSFLDMTPLGRRAGKMFQAGAPKAIPTFGGVSTTTTARLPSPG